MGGNASIKGHSAQHLNLKLTDREKIVPILHSLLIAINLAFYKQFKTPLWNSKLLKNKTFLSGSSLHFFNTKGIDSKSFVSSKPTVGDMDTMVDKTKEQQVSEFLTAYEGKKIAGATLIGFKPGNEQLISLWKLNKPNMKIQIDFEFVDYKNGIPTEWAKFSHSSAWEDMQLGIKGVFHKYLIQALTRLTSQEFYLRKAVGRGKARAEQDILTKDNMYSFAIASKEGGGLRLKYEHVLDNKGHAEYKNNLPVLKAKPTTGYEQDVGRIFSTLFSEYNTSGKVGKNDFWSFTGLAKVINEVTTPAEKKIVLNGFLEKTIGKGAQGLYRNDPNRDIEEKTKAIKYLVNAFGLDAKNLPKLLKTYKDSYKMTSGDEETSSIVKSMAKHALKESPNYKRKGIPHLYNPGSTVEIKNEEFINLCKELSKNNGLLDHVGFNLKVDGAGIRFGKDEQGKPFMMTSSVNEPKYLENFGDFERYTSTKTQDATRIALAKNYDQALKIITNAPFMKNIPKNTIIQAEMLFTPMGKKSKDGITFVNIPYDSSKLGKIMTLVPFSINEYSTGNVNPNADSIKKTLLSASNQQIKVVNNQLQNKGLDVGSIVLPIAKNADKLSSALKVKGEGSAKAKEILDNGKRELSNAIYQSSHLIGKDILGNNTEGLVINLPSGITVKVTSDMMKEKVAQKQLELKETSTSNRHKPAVVTIGSFVGHKGHQQLIDQTLAIAKKVGGDPYIYVSPVVGPEDPIPAKIKVATLNKLYPNHTKNIQVWQEDGSPMKKIEKELVLPANSPYNKIIVVVGADRFESFKSWMNTLEKRMKDPKSVAKYGGTQNQVDFETIKTERNADKGGTGYSFTMLRNMLKNITKDKSVVIDFWLNAFDTEKLGDDWVKKLISITNAGMKKEIHERIKKIKSLLENASQEQKETFANLLEKAKKHMAIHENIDDSQDYLSEK